MSNNLPPNIIWLQWDGDAETPEPCTDDPDDRDVTWCRERVFNRDIQFERSDRITELKRDLEQERQDRKQADLDTIRALGERNDARSELAVWKHEAKRLEAELETFDETAIVWWCEYQDLKAKARES